MTQPFTYRTEQTYPNKFTDEPNQNAITMWIKTIIMIHMCFLQNTLNTKLFLKGDLYSPKMASTIQPYSSL